MDASNYTYSRLFVQRIRVSCAFPMSCCTYNLNCVENENQRVSTQGTIHEYSYEMRSVCVLTNQVSKWKCADSDKAKSSVKVDKLPYHRA